MRTENSRATDEAQIRAQVEQRVEAVRARDIDGLIANHAPDVVSFDVVNRLQYVGSAAIRKRLEEWFASFEGPIGYEIRDLNITAGADTAFCHFLFRVSGALTGGGEVGMWVRATIGLRKLGGKWIITHEHSSVPFDPESGRASLDLQPQ